MQSSASKPLEEKIKLELTTPMEKFFLRAGNIGAIILFASLVIYFENGWCRLAKSYFSVGTACAAIFYSLYFNTDNFYIIDVINRRLLFHFRFFFLKKISVLTDFSEIAALTVNGKRFSSKSSIWWEYQSLMITREGRVIALSDFATGSYEKNLALINQISNTTEARVIDPRKETIAKAVINKNGEHAFRHVPHSFLDSVKEFMFYVGIVFVMLAFISISR